MRRLLVLILVLAVTGCGGPGRQPVAPTPYNDVDVMFLQMSLEQIREGDQLAALAGRRAGDTGIRAVAAGLRGRWRAEAGTMQRWLTGWQHPLTADPGGAAHAGHGDLHALRPADLAELRAARGADADRIAVALLLGHLHNAVQTTRMESAGGAYPPARALADGMTADAQAQVRRLLVIAA